MAKLQVNESLKQFVVGRYDPLIEVCSALNGMSSYTFTWFAAWYENAGSSVSASKELRMYEQQNR